MSERTHAYQAQDWTSPETLAELPFFEYWNDAEIEKDKSWNVSDSNFSKMEEHLRRSGIERQLVESIEAAGEAVRGKGAELACGTGWAARHLTAKPSVETVYCVEYSKHRLFGLAPKVLEHYKVDPAKVMLCLGSFYDLKVADASLDFVLMCEAFHHAAEPKRLLREIGRVLKPGGVVILVGEHIMAHPAVLYAKRAAKRLLSLLPEAVQRAAFRKVFSGEPVFVSKAELTKPDPVAGDHYYFTGDYLRMFADEGYEARRVLTPGCDFQAFLLRRR